jgi:hypothetical protein
MNEKEVIKRNIFMIINLILQKWIYLLLSVMLVVSCNRHHANLENALHLAGDNRIQLETVLNHYGRHLVDSLKYNRVNITTGLVSTRLNLSVICGLKI